MRSGNENDGGVCTVATSSSSHFFCGMLDLPEPMVKSIGCAVPIVGCNLCGKLERPVGFENNIECVIMCSEGGKWDRNK